MRARVIAILASHDSLRAEERIAFKSYLENVFSQADKVASLETDIAALRAEVATLKSQGK